MYTAADGGVGNSRMNQDNMRQASEARPAYFAGAVTVLSSLLIITRSRILTSSTIVSIPASVILAR